ncbi:cation:proton antiporter [Deinococcus ruber]|uniref:Sodium:proton antiporter n=1 Tax=Deinococcus ruber TaxID=1848197 RepID=A0A918CJ12_9DEIO|nr:sodium:proton antiporter [Deinococcus ruber]GGR24129.1 sodium:proton antiporter [Deinococcus ruber]
MQLFETLLVLLIGATVLSAVARRLAIPYPTLLAMGGAVLAFLPGTPRLNLPPELILTLFVAPVLLDAAYDTSLRDLRANWQPVLSLVVVAVGLTTVAVAVAAHLLFPDLPWAAVIALGALLAPPDAVAALAVLQQVRPPHRIRKVLEGESLLNDASALLIYTLAVGTVASGHFSVGGALPTFALVLVGSVVVGWLLSKVSGPLIRRIQDAPTSVILQFGTTFGVWLLAEQLRLSAVITMVVFGLAAGQGPALPARLRVATFPIWEAVTFLLNVFAFTLVGLQLGPVREQLDPSQLVAAFLLLGVVIAVRLLWALLYTVSQRAKRRKAAANATPPLSAADGLVIGWSGMRGIVTLAAALALPSTFPGRDFIQLTAFVVVLGTLVLQGLTLKPLLARLRLPNDRVVEHEINVARSITLKAALKELKAEDSEAALRLQQEYREALSLARSGEDPHSTPDNSLRWRTLGASRTALADLRRQGTIGDDAYRRVEEELDWLELSARAQD